MSTNRVRHDNQHIHTEEQRRAVQYGWTRHAESYTAVGLTEAQKNPYRNNHSNASISVTGRRRQFRIICRRIPETYKLQTFVGDLITQCRN
jgi:hypothetical protein